jgi:phosphatidate cytidylyltransferase
MLAKRVLVVIVLLPIGLLLIYLGGWYYTLMVALLLGLASYEYCQLFRRGGYQPAMALVVAAALAFTVGRHWDGFISEPILVSLFILGSMTYHLIAYERGRDQAGTDFGVTLAGAMYIGWIGSYLVSLRDLPDGLGWVLLALPAVWIADSGAYFIGSRFGRHKMSRRLSPKKSWEGYLGGILFGTLGAALLALGWQAYAGTGTSITPLWAALLGLLLSAVTVLGDLGESMIKRQVGAKDSGTLLPGHGGVFDRIDSWLWAGVLSYYLITVGFGI